MHEKDQYGGRPFAKPNLRGGPPTLAAATTLATATLATTTLAAATFTAATLAATTLDAAAISLPSPPPCTPIKSVST